MNEECRMKRPENEGLRTIGYNVRRRRGFFRLACKTQLEPRKSRKTRTFRWLAGHPIYFAGECTGRQYLFFADFVLFVPFVVPSTLELLLIRFEHVRLFARFLFLAGESSFGFFHVFGDQ